MWFLRDITLKLWFLRVKKKKILGQIIEFHLLNLNSIDSFGDSYNN